MTKRFYLLAILVLLLVAGAWWAIKRYTGSPDLQNELKDRLVNLVTEKSDGLYQLRIGDVNIDIDKSSVMLRKIELTTDSVVLGRRRKEGNNPPTIYDLKLDNIIIRNVDVMAFLQENKASLGAITVSGGELFIRKLDAAEGKPIEMKENKKEVVREVKKALESIHIDSIHLNDLNITYANRKNQQKKVKQVHIALASVDIGSNSAFDSSRIFFAKSLVLSVDTISVPLGESKYKLGANKLVLTIDDSSISTIRGIYLKPNTGANAEAVARRSGLQKDVYDLEAREVIISNFDYNAFMEDSVIRGDLMVVRNPILEVYNDRSQKPLTESKVGKYPHQMLAKVPYTIEVRQIIIEDGRVRYRERNADGDATGQIRFSKINGKVGPVKKSSSALSPLEASFEALFMDKINTDVRFNFPDHRNGRFTVNAVMGAFDVRLLNEAILPLGNVKLEEGKIRSLSFRLNGNDRQATGTTTMAYEGLKVEVMRKDKSDGYKKSGVVSLLANSFLVRTNNTNDDRHPNTYRVTYRRDPTKAFFNLIWKTVFYGVKGNTGIGEKGLDKDRATIHE